MNHPADPAQLRAEMVRKIAADGHAKTPAVAAALETVLRHHFLADVPLAEAYTHQQLACAAPASPAEPSPRVIAMMLDQLDIRPGDNVLHIGTGTGYVAALAAELAPHGRVVTVDPRHAATTQARRTLEALGYGRRVEVITADGSDGAPGRGPYDRIIVTASADDLPEAWIRQLAPDGRIVVPMRLRAMCRSLAFQAHDGILQARTSQPCTVARMRGASHDIQRTSPIGPNGRLTLTWDDDQKAHVRGYDLAAPETYRHTHEASAEVTIHHGETLDGLWLRLAATERGTCGLTATGDAPGLPPLADPAGTPALVNFGSLAYLTRTEISAGLHGTRRYRLGVAAYGPFAARLAAVYLDQVRAWDPHRKAHPAITVHPADTPAEQLPAGQYLRRPSHCLVISLAFMVGCETELPSRGGQ